MKDEIEANYCGEEIVRDNKGRSISDVVGFNFMCWSQISEEKSTLF